MNEITIQKNARIDCVFDMSFEKKYEKKNLERKE